MSPPLTGVLPVDKPVGPTSHDIVAMARRALGIKRVGHTGTLDPFASGLLLLCVGTATRLSEYLTHMDKRYRARALLGVSTDTHDLQGEVIDRSDAWKELDPEAVEDALDRLRGPILQKPPRFSAKKVAGEAAHRRVRRGEDVDLEAVPVTVHELTLIEASLPSVTLDVMCSSGTYVRALARDLGEALGVGAHLTALRRTAVGGFGVDEAVPVDALDDGDRVAAALVTPARAVEHLPSVAVDTDEVRRLSQGQRIRPHEWSAQVGGGPDDEVPVAVLHEHELVAIGRRSGAHLRPRKVFVQ